MVEYRAASRADYEECDRGNLMTVKMSREQVRKHLRRSLPPRLPWYAECAYFGLVFYGILAPAYDISVPLLGAAGLGILAAYSIIRLHGPANPIYRPIKVPILCAISFVLIQVFVHDYSLFGNFNREFITWIFALIVIQSLSIRGERFFHHAALAIFFVGLLALPFLNIGYVEYESGLERTGLDAGIPLANPNDLAAWFGFCCVYFAVLALESKKNLIRLVALNTAIGTLFVVALTVSRSVLAAVALSAILASRRVLKRGFMPLFLFVAIGFGALELGLFDQTINYYFERGAEETGRLQVWPLAIGRLFANPLTGVGVNDIGTYVPESGHGVTPHNSFLYVGLASGILPLLLFCIFWAKAALGAYRLNRLGLQNAPFQLPLMIYTTVIAMTNASVFLVPWACLVLTNAMIKPETIRAKSLTNFIRHRIALTRKQPQSSYSAIAPSNGRTK